MKRSLIISLVAGILLSLATLPLQAQLIRKATTPGQYVDQVTSLFAQHRWDKGKDLLDEGIDKYPKYPNLHYLAGRYWYHFKNFDKARYHLTKSCHINYNHIDAKNLLVNVEELTGNYSSAICYVNELLEVNPYWKGLWLRKVDLYKKQGNFEEANALLKRLRQIYPDDATISSDWFEVLETTYQQARKSGDLEAAEDALREMVIIYPNDPEYQLAYANVLLQKGRSDEALSNLRYALNANPGNVDLIRKAAGILMENGQDDLALALVRTEMENHPSPELRKLQNSLLEESARIEKDSDVYQLYTKVYAKRQSMESLDFLLKESYRRGYNDDALEYIDKMRKRMGDSPRLCMMEYEVYNRMGHQEEARRALSRAEAAFPDSYDINVTACRQRLREASEYMSEGLYAQAVEPLEYVRTKSVEPEFSEVAVRRLAVCYRELSNFPKAEEMLQERMKIAPGADVVVDYASLLVKQGRREQALEVLYESFNSTADTTARKALRYAYEETAIPMIKDAMETGSYPEALSICDVMLDMNPENYWALRYACQAAPDPEKYIDAGMEYYPDDVSFRIRKAGLLVQADRPDEAMELLRDVMDEHPGDVSLAGAYALASASKANKLIKEKEYDSAAAVLDSALKVRPNDEELLFSRGLVYEKQKQWDSAFVYQRHYVPAVLEEKEYLQRMRGLRNQMCRNSVDVGYNGFRFALQDVINSIATVGYTHRTPKNLSFGGRINYSARDASVEAGPGYATGGRGYQFQAFCGVPLGKHLELTADAAAGFRYFPIASVNAGIKYTFPSDWELEAGGLFRVMQDTTIMVGGSIMPAVTLDQFYLAAKVTTGVFHDRLFVNGMVRGRFYPYDGGRSYVEAQAGAGSAPELDFVNIYFTPYLYNRLNTFVSLGFNWLLSDNLSVNISGSWHTLYDQQKDVSYRNLLVGNVQFFIYF